jgi:hypothetical protein
MPYLLCYYPLHIIYFLHLLSTTISVLNLAIFPLLLKPAAQKRKMDWNSSTRNSRLRVTPVVVPVDIWSLPLFRFAESRYSL